MGKHWQDNQCPYCGFINREHSAECVWPGKLRLYKARQAAGENPVIPDGIETMVEMDGLISALQQENDDG